MKAEKLEALTRCFIKSDRAGLIIVHSINFALTANIDGPCNFALLTPFGKPVTGKVSLSSQQYMGTFIESQVDKPAKGEG